MQGPGINRSMFYDAKGERIVVGDGSTNTFTLRDLDQQVLREVSWSQASGRRWGKDYVYRDGVLLASHSLADGLRYHFPDHLTSPRLVTNRCGERLLEHRTSSFGLDLPSGSAQSPDRMRFTMHERDLGQLSTTLDDLDYMHARYYNPSVARFLSFDNGNPKPRAPQTWNRYAYALGNPVKLIDPDGNVAVLPFLVAGAVGALENAAFQFAINAISGEPLTRGVAREAAIGAGIGVSGMGVAQLARRGVQAVEAAQLTCAIARGEMLRGPAGLVSRSALQAAARAEGPTVQVFTKLTQAPEAGRALSVATGENAQALANAARTGGQMFEGQIPSALVTELQNAGLAEVRLTQMSDTVAKEIRFLPQATEFIEQFLKPVS